MLTKRDEEINKCILEWLLNKKYTKSSEAFMQETNLKKEDASKGNKLDKKWGTILSLQKKISDLETQVKQLKEDLENGGANALNSQIKKDSEFMGLPKSIAKSTIKGHRQAITCLAFHPFYKRLASGSEDASIIIWECDEFTQERSLRAHSNTVNYLTFDTNGKYLASCSADLTIKIWNFETMTCYKTLNGHEHTVSSVEFTPDGNFLYSASRDKTIKFWELSTGNVKRTLSGHTEWVRSVTLNPKGTLLASSSDDESIIIWQTDTGSQMNTFTGHDNKIEKVLFLKNEKALLNVYSSDYLADFNKSLVSGGENKGESDIDKINEKLLEKTKLIKAKENIANKDYLLSASRDKTIKLWDVVGGVCIFTFTGHDNWVRDLCEHPSGKYFVSCSDDKSIRVWDLKTGLSSKRLSEAHDSFVVCVSMSPKCKLLASGSNDMTIKVWDCS